MTLGEFKAWFEGFTENISGRPNEKQWKRICKLVKDIDEEQTPWPIFMDRRVRPYRRYWDWNDPMWTTTGTTPTFTSNITCTFKEAGRAEAKWLSAN